MSNGMFCNGCYPNPSGSVVDPDVHLSTSDVWSMAFSMSIKRVVNGV